MESNKKEVFCGSCDNFVEKLYTKWCTECQNYVCESCHHGESGQMCDQCSFFANPDEVDYNNDDHNEDFVED